MSWQMMAEGNACMIYIRNTRVESSMHGYKQSGMARFKTEKRLSKYYDNTPTWYSNEAYIF